MPAIHAKRPGRVLWSRETPIEAMGAHFICLVTVVRDEDDDLDPRETQVGTLPNRTKTAKQHTRHHCMLAQKYDLGQIQRWPVAVEPKLDGVRMLAHVDVDKNEVLFRSRNDKPFTSLDHLRGPILQAVAAAGLRRVVLDGEIVSSTFQETVGQVRQKHGPAPDAVFWVFDALAPEEFSDGNGAVYQVRRRQVESICAGHHPALKIVPAQMCASAKEIAIAYIAARRDGQEGVVVKTLDGLYERKRSHGFMKIKASASDDLTVISAFEGEGKHAGHLGGLVCQIGNTKVRVGTGFTDRQRAEIWRAYRRGSLAGRIAEIGFQYRTESGSLRHPRFIRWRDTLAHGAKE